MQSFLSSFATDKTDDNDFEEGFSHSGNINVNSQDYPVDENSNNKVLSDNFNNELLGKNTNSEVDTNEHSDKQKILNVFGDKEEELQTDCGDDNADDEVRFDPNSFTL